MSISDYEPLFGEWHVESLIGAGTFGKVYKIKREEYGTSYFSALKWISIPSNKAEITNLRCDGMDADSISGYFSDIVRDLTNEIQLMSRLRGQSSIVSYEDHKIIPKTNGIGFNIFIRMELLTSLNDHMLAHSYSSTDIIHLGINICEALELCQKYNIIHRDIKPDNIFVTDLGDYKLGDFGIARQLERTMSNMSTKGTFNYMAPEVYKQLRYDSSVDIYSLGIVLYRLFNNGRLPFLPLAPNPIRPEDRDESIIRRLSGEPMPFPQNAAGFLGEIILKACAYDPKDRYTSPKHLRHDLQAIQLELGEYNNPYVEIYNTPSVVKTTARPDITTTQKIGSIGRVSESTLAAQLSMREKDSNTPKTQGTRALFSNSEKTTSTENSAHERAMSNEATLRRREEKKRQERIRKQKEKKRRKTFSIILYSAVSCVAVFGIFLVTRLINKGATGQHTLNAASATIIEVGTDSLNSSSDKLGVNASPKESLTSSATPSSSDLSMVATLSGTPMNDSLALTPTPTADSRVSYSNWSSWADAIPVDKSEREVEKRYCKKARETKTGTSANDAVNGWQIIGSDSGIVYGTWSDWTTVESVDTDSQEVEKRAVAGPSKTQYKYFRYEAIGLNNSMGYCPDLCDPSGDVTYSSKKTYWSDYKLKETGTWPCSCGKTYLECGGVWWCDTSGPETRTIDGDLVLEYRYRSITTTTTYYLERWTEWSDWQNTTIIADSNTQVRVQYRYRDKLS